MAIVVSKGKNEAYNLDKMQRIYIGTDQPNVKIVAESTRAGNLGTYDSFEKSQVAFEILMQRIHVGKSEVVFMPDDLQVETKLHEDKQKARHISGKKTKGHGGS